MAGRGPWRGGRGGPGSAPWQADRRIRTTQDLSGHFVSVVVRGLHLAVRSPHAFRQGMSRARFGTSCRIEFHSPHSLGMYGSQRANVVLTGCCDYSAVLPDSNVPGCGLVHDRQQDAVGWIPDTRAKQSPRCSWHRSTATSEFWPNSTIQFKFFVVLNCFSCGVPVTHFRFGMAT